MEQFGTFIFLITIGLSLSNKMYVINREIELDGHKTGLYFTRKGELSDNSVKGIVPMYFKISEDSAFYAIFHYNRNNFAAAVAVQIFLAALRDIQTNDNFNSTSIDWKSFLKYRLKKIDDILTQDNITGERAESEIRALIAIVAGCKVTLAEIGDMKKFLFAKSKNMLHSVFALPPGLLNVLGGKASKAQNPKIRGVPKVTEFHGIKYLILGTNSLWFMSEDEIALKVLKNANCLQKAAKEITDSVFMCLGERHNGVIVIDINSTKVEEKEEEEKSFFGKLFNCLNP